MAFASFQELLLTVKGLEIGSLQEPHSDGSAEEEIVYVETNPDDDPLHQCMRSERAAKLSAVVRAAGARAARAADVLRGRDDAAGNWAGAGMGGVARLADPHSRAGVCERDALRCDLAIRAIDITATDIHREHRSIQSVEKWNPGVNDSAHE